MFQCFNKSRNNVLGIADNSVVRNFKNRRFGIIINRNYFLGFLHSRPVLNRAGNSYGKNQFGTDGYSGLTDLPFGRNKPGIDSCTASGNFTADCICQIVN